MASTDILPDLNGIFLLIADQDSSNLRNLKRYLTELGAIVYLAGTMTNARMIISSKLVHAVLADPEFDQRNGFEIYHYYKSAVPSGLFYFMTDRSSPNPEDSSVKVDGIFPKPLVIEQFVKGLREKIQVDSSSISKLDPLTELLRPYLIFRSPVMRRGLMILPKVAASSHSVLVTGETGTGKEMVARAIHGLSPFASGPFVAVNCGAIPESLIEGELFGHEKGSFTGAQTQHRGKFELARNGTLFLDEIGEMPLALQARLLRVLEDKQFYRVGGEKSIKTHLRIVAATQVTLEKSVQDGLFREDLYYRLNVLRIHLPALRERIEDIPLLAWYFLERAFAELNRSRPYPSLSSDLIQILVAQHWRGNARELKNLMTRLAVLLPNNVHQVVPDHLALYFPEKRISPQEFRPDQETQFQSFGRDENVIEVSSFPTEDGTFIPIGTTLKDAEEILIRAAIKHTGGNRTRAAKMLDIGIRTIRRKINESE
ncbi:MAG: sigma-54-dependent Fis family transcriptional regulator [SAR324 cluster bacterium]|nr:sigma-54-dependent Fis family transcriptional regulator [SAR324 cluster bacterium]